MSWLEISLWAFALHLPALLVLYAAWIQHERGGLWKLCHVFGLIGFIPDVLANYITLALLFRRWPGRAYTFSKHLKPLSQLDGWRGHLANLISDVLDRIAPSGNHIHR